MQIDAELVGVAERTNPFDAVGQPPSLPSASSDGVVVGRSVVIHIEKIRVVKVVWGKNISSSCTALGRSTFFWGRRPHLRGVVTLKAMHRA